MDETQFAGLTELLADAETCGRLSRWEQNFLSDMRDRVTQYGDRTSVSEKQWEALHRIEQKVYAT